MLAPFEILEPFSVVEASQMLRERGEEAAIYAGGTELLVLMKERLANFSYLVNIKTIPGLDGIGVEQASGRIEIGPLATHRSLERSPPVRQHAPALAELERQVANVRVRAAGTIGGNLCFAEPHSDPATLLVAWDATLQLTSVDDTRWLPVEDFFTGLLETARHHDELLTGISIPLLDPASRSSYQRFKTHERPVASVAATLRLDGGVIDDARLAAGCVGPKPVRLRQTERLLMGQAPEHQLLADAAELAASEAVVDEEGFESVDYKRHLVKILAGRALRQAAEEVG
jgi:aerobic carbon-monoxide dehydrogenase medium subunit